MANVDKIEDGRTWNGMKTPKVMERMLDLYEKSKWHDCVFKLWNSEGTEEELVFAHNLILASSSPVFEALCFGPLAEGNTIEVPDVDPGAFKMMLKFIYTDCVEFTSVEMACNVLYAAKKYLIYSLAGLSITHILYQINESNCLQIYSFATFIQEEQLLKESWNYLCSHLDHVSKYFSNESLTFDLVKNLVNEEYLNGDEIILYKICLMWAENECDKNNLEKTSENLRKVLLQADILNKIRWPTLTLQEFEEGPQKSGILTNEEIKFITKSINLLNHISLECENQNEVKHDSQCTEYKHDCQGTELKNINSDLLNNSLLNNELLPFSVCQNFTPRKKIQLKKFYCHRFIEKEIKLSLPLENNLKINTYIICNRSVRLTAVFLPAKILSFIELFNNHPRNYMIERDYNEKLSLRICDSNDLTLFSISFYKKVSYGTDIKISLSTPVILERFKEYIIQVELLDTPENYLFGVRNSVSKFPSGLCVNYKDFANIGGNGKFVEAKYFSIISGLELCM